LLAVAVLTAVPAKADDWPTYRRDHYRSAATPEQIAVDDLGLAWVYRSPSPPNPAWAGPAKWDAYHGKTGLSAMRDYDLVYHAIVVGDDLYFGSSVDDAVHCMDLKTGKERWLFTTGGPVRITPTYWDGNLYFGSDDGYAYCIRATDGKLVWRYSPALDRRLVINNNRLISFWPCRTGVLVDKGTAYFAMSMLPWKETYLCAVDAKTGKPEGDEHYVKRHEEMTCEGAFAATEDFLVAPQGRVWVLVFDRHTGQRRSDVRAAGAGSFVMTTPEGDTMGGSSSRDLSVGEANLNDPKQQPYAYRGAKAVVVDKGVAYLISADSAYAVDRKTKQAKWGVKGLPSFSLIVAGDLVFVGGRDQVYAFSADSGKPLWRAPVAGRAHGLAVANGSLIVSTDEGEIYCFRPGAGAERDDETKIATDAKAKPAEAKLAAGPYLRFTGLTTAEVRWQTEEPSPTKIVYDQGRRQFEDDKPKIHHRARLKGLRPNCEYDYQVYVRRDGEFKATQQRTVDTFFNFTVPRAPRRPDPYKIDELSKVYAQAARRIVEKTKAEQGICLVVGCGEGRLAYELAKRTRLHVLAVDTDAAKVAAARRVLQQAGVYGARVAVIQVDSYDNLLLPDGFANLVISDDMVTTGRCPGRAQEMLRVLRPLGGVACLGQPAGVAKKLDRNELLAC
jgi:outer membrane protein assembly factor BamB